ncbi:MAG: cytochrome C [Rubrivivax sp.]|nr:cytochrome C [Rubrivivax sp.]
MLGRALAWLAAVLVLMPNPAAAQSLESALSPGPLVRSHAKLDADCAACHVRFDRAAQDRLCVTCHKEVGQDLQQRTGLHGRAPQRQACRSCHTDHRGRDMDIAPLDTRRFDHRQTDYALDGRHAAVDCASCHPKGRRYRDAPSDCLACHRQDDAHKGSLGVRCADCHDTRGWKQARVDHDRTRFPLTGRHVQARCDSCHKTAVYSDAPERCVDCHRKDDTHKARYGDQCENCHGSERWRTTHFRHDVDTRYALKGRHRTVGCDSCHTGQLYRDRVGTACVDCHRKDDTHKGSLGTDCAACHQEQGWKTGGRFDHERSRFPLRGGHLKAECGACHRDARYRETPSDCIACHRKDDRHAGTLGEDCATCHDDRDWRARRFEHARTRFALAEAHAVPPLRCDSCHRDQKSYRRTPTDCVACHRKDDRHEGQLGERCDSCHGARDWRRTRFDHARARFALVGAHQRVACADCHATPRYRDAPRDCIGCHRRDDRHKGALGSDCQACHNARDWRLGQYDHAAQARYPLDGGHARVACEACHRQPAPRGQAIAPLGRSCVGCHRSDDVHDGGFGARCEQCHSTQGWKAITNRLRPAPATAPGGRS